MEVKKSPKADLENKKSTWMLIGYVVVLAFLFVAFEWTERDIKIDTSQALSDLVFEEEMVPITPVLKEVFRRGNIISDPSSNEYINYCRCINENYTLKSEINYLINKNNDLLNYQNENKHQMQMLKDVISKTEIQNEKLSDFKTKVMSSKTIKLILKLYNIEY